MKWFEDVKTPKAIFIVLLGVAAFAGFVTGAYYGIWLAGLWV